jgi:hypothetical protein
MEKTLGFLTPAFLAVTIFVFNALLPGRWITGYINKPNSPDKMRYHLNGILVFAIIILLWILAGYFSIVPFDWLYRYRWYSLAGAFVTGIIFSLAVVLPFPEFRKSLLADIYLGRIENIQFWKGRVDAKMWLYLYGAIVLELNVLSFTANHLIAFGD